MSNPFKKFFSGVGHFFEDLFSESGREKIAHALDEAQKLLQPALEAVAKVAAETETRSDDQIVALVQKYALGTVTPDMLRNDAVVAGFLKRAAILALKEATGTTLSQSVLDLAIQSAYVVFKQAKQEKAV